MTKWSDAALLAEYGDAGSYGVVSVKSPASPREP